MKLRTPWSNAAPAAGRDAIRRPPGKGARRDAAGKPGRILAAKMRRVQGRVFPWRQAAIYSALVVAIGLGIAAWDRAYESQFRSPSPNVLAKSLVESIIGPGAVHSVSVDEKTHTVDMTIEDVLGKPGQSKTDRRQSLTRESALTISVLQRQLKDLKKITIHIVKDNKPQATATADGIAISPTIEFAPDLR